MAGVEAWRVAEATTLMAQTPRPSQTGRLVMRWTASTEGGDPGVATHEADLSTSSVPLDFGVAFEWRSNVASGEGT